MLICHNASAIIEVSDAPDRSLNQIADEAAAKGVPDLVVRTSLTVGGEEAILLDNVTGVDRLRVVVIVHDDRAYIMSFVGWQVNQEENSPLGILYNTIINSLEFLPLPVYDNYEETEFGISAVMPVTIYSGPASSYEKVGILEAGSPARVVGRMPDVWLEINCPEGIPRRCWVRWDMNALYSYEGPPVTLEIPDPANLKIESSNPTTSPDGRWQTLVTQSEIVTLGVEDARFFYVKLSVTSLQDGTTWTPVSEWHIAGPGQEYPPKPFHWSQDGNYLYYTIPLDHHGACVVYDNIGENLDRLNLTDGSVAGLQGPQTLGIAAISPDESMIVHTIWQPFPSGSLYSLLVRNLATAYTEDWRVSSRWLINLNTIAHENISRIAWSPDSRKVLVMVTELGGNCQPASIAEWALNVETGEFLQVSHTVLPTATP
jgi:hypothetical protein